MEERVEELVLVDRFVIGEALAEVVSLEHARDGDLRHQLDHLRGGELVEPLGVPADFGDLLVEDLEALGEIGARCIEDGLAREARAELVLAGGIADHGGEVADEEGDGVAELLELTELLHQHGVADVEIGARGIEARFYAERDAGLTGFGEALFELGADVQIDDAAREERHLIGDGGEGRHGDADLPRHA